MIGGIGGSSLSPEWDDPVVAVVVGAVGVAGVAGVAVVGYVTGGSELLGLLLKCIFEINCKVSQKSQKAVAFTAKKNLNSRW